MPARQVSFVIRISVDDNGRLAWGRLFRVPEQDGVYFRTWSELIALLDEYVGPSPEGQTMTPPAAE